MTSKLNPVAQEPVLLTAVASAATWALARYGVKVDPQQASEIAGVVLLLGGAFARQLVTPTAKVEAKPQLYATTSTSSETVDGSSVLPPPPDPAKPPMP